MTDAEALSTLIGSIYDCTLEPNRWDTTLAAIKDALDCQSAALHLNDLRANRVLIQKDVGFDPYWMAQHAKYLPEMHALLPAQPILDEPHTLSRHTAPAVIDASPFVRDYLRPQGIADVMQLFLVHSPPRFSGLGLAWSDRHGLITDRDLELACLLLPHLRRAVSISNLLDVSTIERARLAETLDALRCGVVLADARGAILHANRAAEHMMRNGGPIQGSGGLLRVNEASASAELRAALKLATEGEAHIGKTGLAIRLTGPDAPPVVAHVLPLTGSTLRTGLQPTAIAAVFVSVAPDEEDGAAAAAATFGLTPAETRVLTSLLAGRSLAESAAALGIATSTAKRHLDNIFSKTGVSRQADLMRLGIGLVPPVKPAP
jgi:DNA-binding CsgD family transcriptional regulator/PAS domain-containing protein